MGYRLVAAVASLMFVSGASGCASYDSTVQTRFANEYACPDYEVTVSELGGNAYRVSGCGATATYVCASDCGMSGICSNVCTKE